MSVPHGNIRNAIRKLWLWSPQRREALKRSKVVGIAGTHLCDGCGRAAKDIEVDHVIPVGPTPGARGSDGVTWDDFMRRLFCGADGLQTLCAECHDKKTKQRRQQA